ncbi:MAG: DUF4174 domain-containing protein [Cyclobacteriaceae bacterium]|nr:DUF4174 domain-containing protein [Cyclobacteriaceae bacterium]MCH8515544.1 DUF4174 domain-containing protein [Cyclobacteriaceae bacterium]
MKRSIFTLMLVSFFNICQGQSQVWNLSLGEYRWENRVLLVYASSEEAIEAQVESLQKDKNGMADRKLKYFSFLLPLRGEVPDQVQASSDPELILIGLDGQVKRRFQGFTQLDDIYELIDQMPMRQQEIRRRKK